NTSAAAIACLVLTSLALGFPSLMLVWFGAVEGRLSWYKLTHPEADGIICAAYGLLAAISTLRMTWAARRGRLAFFVLLALAPARVAGDATVPGAAGAAGADRDGDGIPDVNDQCPNDPENYNGYQDEDGCPDRMINVITDVCHLPIVEHIYFRAGEARLL